MINKIKNAFNNYENAEREWHDVIDAAMLAETISIDFPMAFIDLEKLKNNPEVAFSFGYGCDEKNIIIFGETLDSIFLAIMFAKKCQDYSDFNEAVKNAFGDKLNKIKIF
jgi:hypothetical protein